MKNAHNAGNTKPRAVVSEIRGDPRAFVHTTDGRGAEHIALELIARGVDAYCSGEASRISVRLDGAYVIIEDDGPGLPFDRRHASDMVSDAEHLLTHATPTAHHDGRFRVSLARSRHGIGLASVLSREFHVTSWRGGQKWVHHVRHGTAMTSPRVVAAGNGRGTYIRYELDPALFSCRTVHRSRLRARLVELTHLFGGLRIDLDEESWCAKDGLAAFVWLHATTRDVTPGLFHHTIRLRDGSVEIAAWGVSSTPGATRWHSWRDGLRTPTHGAHVDGVAAAFQAMRWWPEIAAVHQQRHAEHPHKTPPLAPRVHRTLEHPLRHFLGREAM